MIIYVARTFRPWRAVIAICLMAFIAIALFSALVSEYIPHSEDEVAYIFQAKVFAQNRLTVPTPPFSNAYWSPFVLDFQGQRFGKYPPGWPLLLSLGMRLGIPWVINALLGTVTLALIAWLGRCLYCELNSSSAGHLPVIAAGLGLITPGFLFQSASFLSHAASLFWTTLALLVLYRLSTRHASRGYALITGAMVGAIFITRPFAALGIGLALALFLLGRVIRGEHKWTSLLWVLFGGLPVAISLPLYWWTITGDPAFNAYVQVWPYDRIGFGPDIGPLGYTLLNGVYDNTRVKLLFLAIGLFGWPGWSNLLFLPIPFLTRQATRWDWLLLNTFVALILIHILYWAFGGADGRFPRYYYEALPALLLLTARGIQISGAYLQQKQLNLPFQGRTIRAHWLLIALIATFVSYNFIWNLPPLLIEQKGRYDITPAAVRVVEKANLSRPALILVQDVGLWSDFAGPFVANSPTLDGPIVYAIDLGANLSRQVRAHFAERECWKLRGEILERCPDLQSPNP